MWQRLDPGHLRGRKPMRERCGSKDIAVALFLVFLIVSVAGCSKQSPPAAQNPRAGKGPAARGESPVPAAKTAPSPAAENPAQPPAPAPPPKPKPRTAELA